MRKKKLIIMLTLLAVVFIGAIQTNNLTTVTTSHSSDSMTDSRFSFVSDFDSENITVVLLTPSEQSEVVGTFNMTLNVTSENGPLNLTLFVEDDIHPDYNKTSLDTLPAATETTLNITVNTVILPEGLLNFTLLFEDNSTGTDDKESYEIYFNVNNHGVPGVKFIAPAVDTTLTGLADLTLNVTSDYSEVVLNITVDGEITEEFNMTTVPVGQDNYTINCSRYENGQHTINVTVITEEGLAKSTVRTFIFLDYVRIAITGFANYNEISGLATISVKAFTPYDEVTLSAYVDGELTDDVVNITVPEGRSTFTLDTTPYSEGEHNFTFVAYDEFGHKWTQKLILIVDNHGIPEAEFLTPEEDVVVGLVSFTVNIDTTWDTVTVTVYVDDEPIEDLTNVTVEAGEYTFTIDTSVYSKWEHTVRVEINTDEGLSNEITETFGFANVKTEEIVSVVAIAVVALIIPLYRWRKGEPIRPVLLADALFLIVFVGAFIILGINSVPIVIWHFNLASIWALGSLLIFMNWAMPFLTEEYDQ